MDQFCGGYPGATIQYNEGLVHNGSSFWYPPPIYKAQAPVSPNGLARDDANQGQEMSRLSDAPASNSRALEMTAPLPLYHPSSPHSWSPLNEDIEQFANYFACGSSPTTPPHSPISGTSPTSSVASLYSPSSIGSAPVPEFPEFYFSDAPLAPVYAPLSAPSVLPPLQPPTTIETGFPPNSGINGDDVWAFLSQMVPPEHPLLATAFIRPDQAHLRLRLREILSSSWFISQSPEPKDDKSRSVLLAFLSQDETGGTYRCLFDGCDKQMDRQDRALGHVRMHIGHRPYACNQQCAVIGCQERFYCRSYLRSHTHRQKEECGRCLQSFFRNEMRKHKVVCQPLQNQRMDFSALTADFLTYQSMQYTS